jgi:hypothetical protein
MCVLEFLQTCTVPSLEVGTVESLEMPRNERRK